MSENPSWFGQTPPSGPPSLPDDAEPAAPSSWGSVPATAGPYAQPALPNPLPYPANAGAPIGPLPNPGPGAIPAPAGPGTPSASPAYVPPPTHAPPPNWNAPPPPGALVGAQYGQYVTVSQSGMGIASLVVGIVSIVINGVVPVIGVLVGGVAIVLGAIARRRIRESNGLVGGSGLALAGLICGIVGLVVSLLYALFFLWIIAMMFATTG